MAARSNTVAFLECSNGYVQVLTLEQRQWEGLVKLMNEPAWALDPALRDPLERGRRGAEINRHLREWRARKKSRMWSSAARR